MGANEIKAGKAAVEVSAKDKLTGSLNRISARFKSFAGTIKSVGSKLASDKLALGGLIGEGLSVAGLAAAVKEFASVGSELHDMAIKTGLSVEELSKLKFAAEQAGADMESVGKAAKGMQKFMGDVALHGKTSADTLRQLGLSAESLKGLGPDELFAKLAKAVGGVPDPTLRGALAMKVFGKAGTELSEVFSNFDEMTGQAEKLGLVMSKQDADAADELGDVLDQLKSSARAVFNLIGAVIAPHLTEMAQRVLAVIMSVRKWIDENRELVGTILRTVGIVTAIGAAIGVAAGLIFGMGAAFAAVSSILGGVAAGFGMLVSIVGAILSPIGLLIAAVIGLGGYFLYASGLAGQAFDDVRSNLGSLVGEAKGAFGAISNALAGGDIRAAAAVLWTFLKLQWVKGTAALRGYWSEFTGFFIEVWQSAVYGLAGILTDAWDGVQSLWTNFITGLLAGWEIFSSTFIDVWKGIEKYLSKSFAWIMSFFDGSKYEDTAKAIEDSYAKDQAKRHGASNQKLAELGKANMDRQAEIAADNKAKQDALRQQQEQERRARAAAASRGVGDADAAYQQALKDFENAKAAAEEVKPIVGAKDEKGELKPFDFGDKHLAPLTSAAGAGTFSASAASRMTAAQPLQQRIANATEETAKGVRKIANKPTAAFT